MLLNELLNSADDIAIDIIRKTNRVFLAEAKIGNILAEYEAKRGVNSGAYDHEEAGATWEVAFFTTTLDDKGERKGKTSWGITGTGHELEVLSFAKECTLQFAEACDPWIIVFDAAKPDGKTTRGNIYEKMLKRWNIPKYKITKRETNQKTYFRLERERKFSD